MADDLFNAVAAEMAAEKQAQGQQPQAPGGTLSEALATGGGSLQTRPEDMQMAQAMGSDAAAVAGAVAGDVGTGITELPRAALKGTRDAVQNTMDFAAEALNNPEANQRQYEKLKAKVQARGGDVSKIPTPESGGIKAPQLFEVDKPTSVTGQFAASTAQLAVGLLGLSKLSAPVQAGRAVAGAVEIGKAAAVGAVAFDPSEKRLSDLVESIPAISNPVTAWLSSQPGDSRGMSRLKNALESIGMDVAVVLPIQAGLRLMKARRDLSAGTITPDDFQKAVAASEKEVAQAAKPGPIRDVIDVATPTKEAPGKKFQPAAPDDAKMQNLLSAMQKDAAALEAHGDWDSAIAAGHKFADGSPDIPWQKLRAGPEGDINNGFDLAVVTSRVAEALKRSTNEAKGGAEGVLSDPMVRGMVTKRANLWNEDPAELMATLQKAGKNARSMAADMEASYLVASRAFQDTYAMAQRILAGNLDEFGGDAAAANAALKDMVSIVGTAYNAASSMRASAGRTMRRMRSEFQVTDEAVGKLTEADPRMLAQMIASTGGNPAAIRKLADQSIASKTLDAAQWLLTNNLLWSPVTHSVNVVTNLYMAAARPLERIIGSAFVGKDAGAAMRREAQYQLAYYSNTLVDGWRSAVKAWQLGDSVLTPHNVEAHNVGGNLSQQVAQMQFRPPNGMGDVLYNVFAFATKSIGLPTRALGAVDEMVKQVVYRSKVMASAHRRGLEMGLDGANLQGFLKKELDEAFDINGRALREDALMEAKAATFQQDLLPRTFGSGVQAATTAFPPLRLILPFIRTPINVLRTGWKMTPGLNVLQTEYRQMLTGAMGKEMQAQAIGQMSMGSLLMGTMAFFATQGMVTGGGPTDPVQRKRLMDTGWRPYSFVRMMPDGSKQYVQYGKFDPVAMPFGVVADLVDAFAIGEREGEDFTDKLSEGGTALLISLTKQMANKSFLLSINQAVDALSDPDRSFGKFAQQMGANFMPMASGMRFINPDPHLRETRTVADKIISQVPGLSEKLPPRRDAFGEPVLGHKGLASYSKGDIAEMELQRMITENGRSFGPPGPIVDNVDLREITSAKGENAYDLYQRLAAKPSKSAPDIKTQLTKVMQSAAYKRAPDGDSDLKGTKLFMITGVMSKYRDAARKQLLADPNIRAALGERQAEVAAAYAAQSAPKSPEKAGTEGLANIGKAFGVDLGPLLPNQ